MAVLEKGSEEWLFAKEYYAFRKTYHDAQDGTTWFEEMMRAGNALMEKYSNMDFSEYAKKLVFDHFEDVEKRWRKDNGK